jgi:hypothetical protein
MVTSQGFLNLPKLEKVLLLMLRYMNALVDINGGNIPKNDIRLS